MQAPIIGTLPIKANSLPSHLTRRCSARLYLRNIHLWLGPQRGGDWLASYAPKTPPQRRVAVSSVQRTGFATNRRLVRSTARGEDLTSPTADPNNVLVPRLACAVGRTGGVDGMTSGTG
jgi:hypothetical protein